MIRFFRILILLLCAAQVGFAVAFALELPFAVRLWPLPYANSWGFLLIASIFAAAAVSTAWCILSKEYGALTGIALDYLVMFVPVTVLAFQLSAANRSMALRNFGIVCIAGVVVGLVLFLWSRRIPIRDTRPMPTPVRIAFAIFVVALLIVGGALIARTPNVLPWRVTAEGSMVYGWIFLGAAAYFGYGLVRPAWGNAVGQLLGFLAYDVVLIVPFLLHLPSVAAEYRVSLILYTLVVASSGVLATWYLFVNRETRFKMLGARERRTELIRTED